MGYSVNRVFLLGYVGKDPTVRAIPSGTKVANFSMATDESYKDKNGQKVDKVEWHNLVAWSGLADVADKYIKKGSKIHVEGHLQTRSWDDKDGKKHYSTEIVIDNLVLLGDKSGSSTQASRPAAEPSTQRPASSGPGLSAEDDLPF